MDSMTRSLTFWTRGHRKPWTLVQSQELSTSRSGVPVVAAARTFVERVTLTEYHAVHALYPAIDCLRHYADAAHLWAGRGDAAQLPGSDERLGSRAPGRRLLPRKVGLG